ncbi:universal stress protein [Subtercola frigoramans]
MAQCLGVPLEAITAWSSVSGPYLTTPPQLYGAREAKAKSTVELAATAVFGAVLPPWFHAYSAHGPVAGVLAQQSRFAKMLIIGRNKGTPVVGNALGSVALECVENAHCPVLLVRNHRSPHLTKFVYSSL